MIANHKVLHLIFSIQYSHKIHNELNTCFMLNCNRSWNTQIQDDTQLNLCKTLHAWKGFINCSFAKNSFEHFNAGHILSIRRYLLCSIREHLMSSSILSYASSVCIINGGDLYIQIFPCRVNVLFCFKNVCGNFICVVH